MSSDRKPSLFAQKMQKLRAAREGESRFEETARNTRETRSFGDRSYVVSGEEADVIHRENIALLSRTSVEEILETREELLSSLRPETIQFLKQKRRATESTFNLESSFSDLSTKESSSTKSEKELEVLHMDKEEPEKTKWMEDVPKAPQPLPNSLYNARFDFEGDLLPYVEENKSTCERGLYHHGEEPHRPGYSIEELYQLSRSSMTRQRITALNTLASILEKEFILSSCLDTELLKVLLDSGLFLILRFSLDDKLAPVHLAALRAISSLFWKPVDMHYLSDMVGTFGDIRLPSLFVNDEVLSTENLNEMKDADLINLDVVKGALRTDIVQRFKYIMDDPLVEVDHLLFIIRCLTRFCYHSAEATSIVINTPSLIELLFAHCQLHTSSNKLYIPKLMILFRVIASQSEKFATALQARLNIIPFLLNVIGDVVTKTTTASQCLHLWLVFLHYGIGDDAVNELSPMFFTLLKQLQGIRGDNSKTGVISYASALVTLLTFLTDRYSDAVRHLFPTLDELCCQWLRVMSHESNISREFVKLTSNTIYLLSGLPHPIFFPSKMRDFLKSAAFTRSTENLKRCSFLLHATKKNFVPSLPSLNVPAAILSTNNDLLLVHAAVKFCLRHGDRDLAEHVLNEPLWFYVSSLLEHPHLAEISNLWCARYEIYFLCDILDLCLRVDAFVDRKLLQMAFVLVRIIPVDDASRIEKIFGDVIFNDRIYRHVMTEYSDAATVLRDLESMEQFFARELNLPKVNMALMSTARGCECALSTDWYYVPILRISNAEQKKANVDTESLRSVLRWIHLLETLSDDLRTDMSVAARYCRVSCVFLCGDVFLEVADLLSDILREMLTRNEKLNFKKPVPGISSFYDFYRELCEQFVSSSYGNAVFGAYLLAPLQQKHNCELRRYIWTEQAVAFRFLNVSEHQLPIPISCFLEPCETDLNLVMTYLRSIASGVIEERFCPILYRVGLHHVATFVKKFKGETAAKELKKKIESIVNKEMRDKFLNYTYICS